MSLEVQSSEKDSQLILRLQVVFHLFIQLMTVTLEEKEEILEEQLVMLMVMMRVSLPGKSPRYWNRRFLAKD